MRKTNLGVKEGWLTKARVRDEPTDTVLPALRRLSKNVDAIALLARSPHKRFTVVRVRIIACE